MDEEVGGDPVGIGLTQSPPIPSDDSADILRGDEMKKVYVLMYWSVEDGLTNEGTGESTPPKMRPYAVFEDKGTAEAMKRPDDTIVEVPYFHGEGDPAPNLIGTKTSTGSGHISTTPCDDKRTFPYYPYITCQNTAGEHKWAVIKDESSASPYQERSG